MFRRSTRAVLLLGFYGGMGASNPKKKQAGQTFVLPQRHFWVPESNRSTSAVKLLHGA